METAAIPTIRFPQGLFPELRKRLLVDTSVETFALLAGIRTDAGGCTVIKVTNVYYPQPGDYHSQSLTSLQLKRDFIYKQLADIQQTGAVDTLIDVHTHPFSQKNVAFSGVDDRDEKNFNHWLHDIFENISYASIVLSQTDYAARLWHRPEQQPPVQDARIKTQILSECCPCATPPGASYVATDTLVELQNGIFARSVLAMGLDVMRQIMADQTIAIVGVGGLGSVIAENLIHSGFQSLCLIDPDHVEVTNLNRIVGAGFADAEANRFKVDVVKDHLQRINPRVQIDEYKAGIESTDAFSALTRSDWVIVATDNHFSRFKSQQSALRLGLPLISAGVNISVENQQITDISGEVIIARYGDGLCLNCLERINPTLVAAEQYRNGEIGRELVNRGYVPGQEEKEPAVKTLNAIVGAMAVDMLLNQYTQRQTHVPIMVYENNHQSAIYPGDISTSRAGRDCYHCS